MGKENLDHLERKIALLSQQSRLEQQQTSTYQDVSHLGNCAQSNQNAARAEYQQLVSEMEISARSSQQIQLKLNALGDQQPRQNMEGMSPPPAVKRRTDASHEPPSSSSGVEIEWMIGRFGMFRTQLRKGK